MYLSSAILAILAFQAFCGISNLRLINDPQGFNSRRLHHNLSLLIFGR
jgi:hypothetical protein